MADRHLFKNPMPLKVIFLFALCSAKLFAAEPLLLRQGKRQIEVAIVDVKDPKRRAELETWITAVVASARTWSGGYPLQQARIEVRQSWSLSDSAVPWGQTDRTRLPVMVKLQVRRSATLDELLTDWTAPHELAHLYHPYLGDRGRWLAEGFASFNEYRFMTRMGKLSVDAAWRRLDAGFQRGAKSNAKARMESVGFGNVMRLYWAGAVFWLDVDLQLRKLRNSSLDQLMDRYTSCCMRGEIHGIAPEKFIAKLDQLQGGDALLAPLFEQYAEEENFPETATLYQQLGLRRDAGNLRFFGTASKAELRHAIMRGRAR